MWGRGKSTGQSGAENEDDFDVKGRCARNVR